MEKIINKHKFFWKSDGFLKNVLIGLFLIAFSLVINYFAGNFATVNASNSVTDIILDNVPVFNINFIFVDGSLILFLFILSLCIWEPKHVPFALKSLALFIVIRSVFITLTHLGPFPTQSPIEPNKILEKITFAGDLFFSGHTGMPFLFALIFWQHKIVRNILIAVSILFGASVLLGHLHYSIDVFSAFFITYGIFCLAKELFKKDFSLVQDNH